MSPRTVEERLEAIEEDLIYIKASAGTVKLGAPTLTLLWAVMLACMACVVFVVRLEGKVEAYAHIVSEDHVLISKHFEAPGHSVSVERIEELRERVERVEKTGGVR